MFNISLMELNTYLSLFLFLLSIAIPYLHKLFFDPNKSLTMPDLLLKYSLFFNVGCLFLSSALGQLLYPKNIAFDLGWSFSEFQTELAFSELSLGFLGLICNLFDYQFWLATIISAIIWLLGSAISYFYYHIAYNMEFVSTGTFVIYWNIFIAIWLAGLIGLYFIPKTKELHKLEDVS